MPLAHFPESLRKHQKTKFRNVRDEMLASIVSKSGVFEAVE